MQCWTRLALSVFIFLLSICNTSIGITSKKDFRHDQADSRRQTVPLLQGQASSVRLTSVSLYLTLAKDGTGRCHFGVVEACRIFHLPVTLKRDTSNGRLEIQIEKKSLQDILPDVPAVMPAISPNGTHLAFMATTSISSWKLRYIYVYDLVTKTIISVTERQTHNNQGQWGRWLDNQRLLYSNTNNCTGGAAIPGCNRNSRFQDLLVSWLSETGSITSTQIVMGDVNTQTGLNSRPCAGEDPAPHPTDSNIIAFHSASIDGVTAVHGLDCPWLQGKSGIFGVGDGQPVPVVMKLDARSVDNLVKSLVPGHDYWLFDLKSAGISGCAHPDFGPNAEVVCTEQGTVPAYRECSDPTISVNDCARQGGFLISFSRVFGFAKENTLYRNLHKENSTAPFFKHLHPSQLPTSTRFWPTKGCAIYNTKYVELGPESLVFATVECKATQEETTFSRQMLIDTADPENPVYFDLTGWVEDQYPERWKPGTASGFTGTFSLP